MRIGTKHTDVRQGRLVLDYHCQRCDLRCEAAVDAKGRGAALAPFGLFPSVSRANASDSAEENQRLAARTTLDQAQCPGCQRRRAGALTGWLLATLFYAVMLAAYVAVATFVLVGWDGKLWILATMAIAAGGVFLWRSIAFATVGRRVRFGRPKKPYAR